MGIYGLVRGTVEASESFRGKLVKTMGEEASCCRTSCIYRGEEDQSFSMRSSSESKMTCMKRANSWKLGFLVSSRRSIYSSKESRKDQCEGEFRICLRLTSGAKRCFPTSSSYHWNSLKREEVGQISGLPNVKKGVLKAIEGNAKECQNRSMGVSASDRDKTKRMGSTFTARSASLAAANSSLVDALLGKFTQCAVQMFSLRNKLSSEYLRIKEQELECNIRGVGRK
ncbi:hypothetical protein Tco_0104904 [Tanacetum coccineum]